PMRTRRFAFALTALIALTATASKAQLCEPAKQTRQSLKRLEDNDLPRFQRIAQQRAGLKELVAQHPGDIFLHLAYIDIEADESESARTAVIAEYKRLAAEHDRNPDFAFLYAYSLQGVDTPDAIARLKALASGTPAYPLAARQLARI